MLNIVVPQAMSIYLNELVYELKSRKIPITTLSLGEAFFDLPKVNFDEFENEELVHYCSSRGLPELREALTNMYSDLYNCDVQSDEMIISAGSKILIYMSLLGCRDSGSKVAILDPAWLSYVEQCRLVGLSPVSFPWQRTLYSVTEELSDEYAALIINNPNNPGGFVYSYDELSDVVELCSKKGITVIIDEAYSDFTSFDSVFSSMANLAPHVDNLVVVNSLSKNLGMSGFRIGYAVTNPKNIDQLVKVNQHLITCAPTILQKYVASNLSNILKATKPQISALLEKRNEVLNIIEGMELCVIPGTSTFYIMLKVDCECDVFDFVIKLLLVDNISVVPGIAYGKSTEKYVRVSIGTEDIKIISESLNTIKDRIVNGWGKNISSSDLLKLHNLREL